MRQKCIIVLSGGLDSAFNLAKAKQNLDPVLCLSFNYGQRAVERELAAARALSEFYAVPWNSIDISWLGEISHSSLNKVDKNLPELKLDQLNDAALTDASMRSVWVPNRNGIFFNIAAAHAETLGAEIILAGFNKEEAATFPDNSVDFMLALENSFSLSCMQKVRVESYCKNLTKTEIISEALAIKLPLNLVWSCYEKGPKRCWKCESCLRQKRALLANGKPGQDWLREMGDSCS